MSDLTDQRQCEEMSSDEDLEAYYESQVDDQLTINQLTSSDTIKIELGLQSQSIYRKLQSEQNPFVRQILIKCLANILDRDLVLRQKSWTKSDREKRYELHQDPHLVECELNPF